MSQGTKISLSRAMHYATRFMQLIEPHCEKAIIVGSVRRQVEMVNDIEICCLPKYNKKELAGNLFGFTEMESEIDRLFGGKYPGMVKNGKRLKAFKYPELSLELYIPQVHDYGRILAIRTGPLEYSRDVLAFQWHRLGWAGTEDGLRKRKQCMKHSGKWILKPLIEEPDIEYPPSFETEKDFYDFLGFTYVEPEYRVVI